MSLKQRAKYTSVIEDEQIDFKSKKPPLKATFSLCNWHINPIFPDSKQFRLDK